MRRKLTALLPILLAVLLLGGVLAVWVLSTTQQQDASTQGRNSGASSGPVNESGAAQSNQAPINSPTSNDATDTFGPNGQATSKHNGTSAHPTPSPTSAGTRDQQSNSITAPDPTNANNTTNTTPPHKPKNPNVPDPATLNPLDVTELEISIPVKLDATLDLLRANSPEESSPFHVFAVLACQDRGPPLNGWRLVEDRARSVDAEGQRLDPDPTPNLPRTLYDPRPGEVAVVSRSDLSPLYAHAFPELAKILDDAGTLMAFPAEFQEADKDEAGNYTEPHSIRTELPLYARGPKTFSMDIQVSQFFVAMAAARRGEWTIHLFGFRDQPPISVKLGPPKIEPTEIGPWLVTFPEVETSLAEVTGGRTIDIRGQFKHQATGVGAPLAGVMALRFLPSEPTDFEPAKSIPANEESKTEEGADTESQPKPGFDQLRLVNETLVEIKFNEDGSFNGSMLVPKYLSNLLETQELVAWWPIKKVDTRDASKGLWLVDVMGGTAIRDPAIAYARLEKLLRAAATGQLPPEVALEQMSGISIADQHRWPNTKFGFGMSGSIAEVENGDEFYGDTTLALPTPTLESNKLDFGTIPIGGALVDVTLDSLDGMIPIPDGVEGTPSIDLSSSFVTKDRRLKQQYPGNRPFARMAPGQVITTIVPGVSMALQAEIDMENRYEGWPPSGYYGTAEWSGTTWPPSGRIQLRIPLLIAFMRELRVSPAMDSGEESAYHVLVCATSLSSNFIPEYVFSHIEGNEGESDVWQMFQGGQWRNEWVTSFWLQSDQPNFFPVPKASKDVTGYWVSITREGYHPRAVYCELRDRWPLVVELSPKNIMIIEVHAPDAKGSVTSAGIELESLASQSPAALLAEWSGLYSVTAFAFRADDGIEVANAGWRIGVGNSEKLELKVPSGVPVRVTIQVAGRGFDLGFRTPLYQGQVTPKSHSAINPGHESPDPREADVTITIPYPTQFVRWMWPRHDLIDEDAEDEFQGSCIFSRCGGMPLYLGCLAASEQGQRHYLWSFASGRDEWSGNSVGGYPTQLIIGSQVLPLTRTDSVDAVGRQFFRLSIDLPVRIEVVAREIDLDEHEVEVITRGTQFDCTATIDPKSGRAFLWRPSGPSAILIEGIDLGPRSPLREVNVPTSGVVTVEIGPNGFLYPKPKISETDAAPKTD